MFNGTKLSFKLRYFITSMAPAYYLFFISLVSSFDRFDLLNLPLFGGFLYQRLPNRKITLILGIVILSVLMLILSKCLIKSIYSTGESILILEDEVFHIYEYNAEIVSFLLGTILPSIIILDNNLFNTILVFLMIQILIYKLMLNTSGIFINLWLIIFHQFYFVNAIRDDNEQEIIVMLKKDANIHLFKNKKYKAKYLKRISDDGGNLFLGEDIDEYSGNSSGN